MGSNSRSSANAVRARYGSNQYSVNVRSVDEPAYGTLVRIVTVFDAALGRE